MENTEFAVGDLVELKSGSPKMTVSGMNSTGAVIVRWYNFNKSEFGINTLEPDILKKVNI